MPYYKLQHGEDNASIAPMAPAMFETVSEMQPAIPEIIRLLDYVPARELED